MAGGASVFALTLAFAVEPACSSWFSGQTLRAEWWPKFLCESNVGDVAIAYLIYGLIVVFIFQLSERARETRMLHRAYVSVLPRGIAAFVSQNGMLSCDVVFHNDGNLPATKVRWFIDRKFSTDGRLSDFPVENVLSGNGVIPARTEMKKGAKAIRLAELDSFKRGGGAKDRWLYVWGRVAYEDGFGRDCRTDFCFRYNLAGTHDGTIAAEAARQHEYGNRTDED
jgi:hypothetical protein